MAEVTFDEFNRVDIRVGRVVRAAPFPEARKPAYRLWIDFGSELGVKKSSAQLVDRYTHDELEGRLVLAVVNFPPRQIGPVRSEVLVLGVPDDGGWGRSCRTRPRCPHRRPPPLTNSCHGRHQLNNLDLGGNRR